MTAHPRTPGASGVSAPSGLVVRAEAYDGPAARQLVARVQQEYVVRYGGVDGTTVDPADFAPPTGGFLVGYLPGQDGPVGGHGEVPVVCGGVRRLTAEVAEIKRMYTEPAYRRRGLSRVLLAALEDTARALGYAELWLETGSRQPEALALYASAGYARIPSYGYYRDSPENACFGKPLMPARSAPSEPASEPPSEPASEPPSEPPLGPDSPPPASSPWIT